MTKKKTYYMNDIAVSIYPVNKMNFKAECYKKALDEIKNHIGDVCTDCLFNNTQVCDRCYERRYLNITVNALKEAEGLEI